MIGRRTLIAGTAALAAVSQAKAASRADLVVGRSGRTGTFSTLAAAFDHARSLGRPVHIRVEPGVYAEKLKLDIPDLHLSGTGPASILSFGAASGLADPQGRKWGTGGSATLTVTAPGVTLSNLTIRNSFDYPGNARIGAVDGAQAVALSVARGADRAVVRNCAIEGYQDTLYVQESCRALFTGCTISGNVDFIFGGATAIFERCEIRSRFVPGAEIQGFVAAPSTPVELPAGLIFRDSRLTREPGLPDDSVWLGRPWRAGGNMRLTGAALFDACWMDSHIRRDGWTWMGYTDPEGIRRQLTPAEARLFEHASTGPGAGTASFTRKMLDSIHLRWFSREQAFGDWHPA
ncbi:pectinesterase family protein [Sphingomonas sp.]|uniref:pectinesterase family protein n=1 Tax=Sphingomonas sp. TaxID=28214 RepID=UPI002ED7C06C